MSTKLVKQVVKAAKECHSSTWRIAVLTKGFTTKQCYVKILSGMTKHNRQAVKEFYVIASKYKQMLKRDKGKRTLMTILREGRTKEFMKRYKVAATYMTLLLLAIVGPRSKTTKAGKLYYIIEREANALKSYSDYERAKPHLDRALNMGMQREHNRRVRARVAAPRTQRARVAPRIRQMASGTKQYSDLVRSNSMANNRIKELKGIIDKMRSADRANDAITKKKFVDAINKIRKEDKKRYEEILRSRTKPKPSSGSRPTGQAIPPIERESQPLKPSKAYIMPAVNVREVETEQDRREIVKEEMRRANNMMIATTNRINNDARDKLNSAIRSRERGIAGKRRVNDMFKLYSLMEEMSMNAQFARERKMAEEAKKAGVQAPFKGGMRWVNRDGRVIAEMLIDEIDSGRYKGKHGPPTDDTVGPGKVGDTTRGGTKASFTNVNTQPRMPLAIPPPPEAAFRSQDLGESGPQGGTVYLDMEGKMISPDKIASEQMKMMSSEKFQGITINTYMTPIQGDKVPHVRGLSNAADDEDAFINDGLIDRPAVRNYRMPHTAMREGVKNVFRNIMNQQGSSTNSGLQYLADHRGSIPINQTDPINFQDEIDDDIRRKHDDRMVEGAIAGVERDNDAIRDFNRAQARGKEADDILNARRVSEARARKLKTGVDPALEEARTIYENEQLEQDINAKALEGIPQIRFKVIPISSVQLNAEGSLDYTERTIRELYRRMQLPGLSTGGRLKISKEVTRLRSNIKKQRKIINSEVKKRLVKQKASNEKEARKQIKKVNKMYDATVRKDIADLKSQGKAQTKKEKEDNIRKLEALRDRRKELDKAVKVFTDELGEFSETKKQIVDQRNRLKSVPPPEQREYITVPPDMGPLDDSDKMDIVSRIQQLRERGLRQPIPALPRRPLIPPGRRRSGSRKRPFEGITPPEPVSVVHTGHNVAPVESTVNVSALPEVTNQGLTMGTTSHEGITQRGVTAHEIVPTDITYDAPQPSYVSESSETSETSREQLPRVPTAIEVGYQRGIDFPKAAAQARRLEEHRREGDLGYPEPVMSQESYYSDEEPPSEEDYGQTYIDSVKALAADPFIDREDEPFPYIKEAPVDRIKAEPPIDQGYMLSDGTIPEVKSEIAGVTVSGYTDDQVLRAIQKERESWERGYKRRDVPVHNVDIGRIDTQYGDYNNAIIKTEPYNPNTNVYMTDELTDDKPNFGPNASNYMIDELIENPQNVKYSTDVLEGQTGTKALLPSYGIDYGDITNYAKAFNHEYRGKSEAKKRELDDKMRRKYKVNYDGGFGGYKIIDNIYKERIREADRRDMILKDRKAERRRQMSKYRHGQTDRQKQLVRLVNMDA